MDKEQATWNAIFALRKAGDTLAAKVLEDDLKINGRCQYCDKTLATTTEMITLLDTCEECELTRGIHPAQMKGWLKGMVKTYCEKDL